MKKIKIRGLIVIAGTIFLLWGGIIILKGLYDAFWAEPEANYFSPKKWEFVSQNEWLRWSGFELSYGLFCFGFGIYLRKIATSFPEYQEKEDVGKT